MTLDAFYRTIKWHYGATHIGVQIDRRAHQLHFFQKWSVAFERLNLHVVRIKDSYDDTVRLGRARRAAHSHGIHAPLVTMIKRGIQLMVRANVFQQTNR